MNMHYDCIMLAENSTYWAISGLNRAGEVLSLRLMTRIYTIYFKQTRSPQADPLN
jgi:hypothetical protein